MPARVVRVAFLGFGTVNRALHALLARRREALARSHDPRVRDAGGPHRPPRAVARARRHRSGGVGGEGQRFALASAAMVASLVPDGRARVRASSMTAKGRDIDMRRVMVKYKVKPDRAAENERYIKAVFAQLERDRPAGLRYASFKLEDGVSFVHIASIETADDSNPLLALESFKEFAAQIKDRCDEPPVTTTLSEIGAYRAFVGEHT